MQKVIRTLCNNVSIPVERPPCENFIEDNNHAVVILPELRLDPQLRFVVKS